jgi:FkbM family methyltransferase
VRDHIFKPVSVAGGPAVSFCLDPASGDLVAAWLLEHGWIDEPVQRAFAAVIEPGMRVLDLGSHLGTFALAAAALGAEVLAVDAAASHVELLRAAATRNGFGRLAVEQRAICEVSGARVEFVERSIHGHLRHAGDPPDDPGLALVRSATVDELLEAHGWDGVEVVKLDIEGLETAALGGMRGLFARGLRPALVVECNGSTLPWFGSSTHELRERLEQLGYELLLIDHLRPGRLVRTDATALQPECACDYLALARWPPSLAQNWAIEEPFTIEELAGRLLDFAAAPASGHRSYAASVLAGAPDWLASRSDVRAALRALALDTAGEVRDALARVDPDDEFAPQPREGRRPEGVRLWARELELRCSDDELDPPFASARHGRELLEPASFQVRSGELIGLLVAEEATARAVLHALAGQLPPAAGELECVGRVLALVALGEALEPRLSAAENVLALAAFHGCDVVEALARLATIAERTGVSPDAMLSDLTVAETAALATVTALELVAPDVLLLGRLPALDRAVRDWLAARVAGLLGSGTSVVQIVCEPADLLAPAARLLWLDGPTVFASGHPDSLFEAAGHAQLGLVTA